MSDDKKVEVAEVVKAVKKAKVTKKAKVVKIRVIKTAGKSMLVQWVEGGTPKRVHVPASAIVDGQCSVDDLSAGIPYGVPWEEIVPDIHITSEQLANILRNRGIWTLEDATRNSRIVMGAINALIPVGFSTFMKAVRQHKIGEKAHD